MQLLYRYAYFTVFLLLFTVNIAAGGLPGWITFTDKDNNSYYVDKTGKIYTEEKPDFIYKPVSAASLTYSLAQGKILISKYNKFEGLLLLKSVLLLSSKTEDAYFAGAEAASTINRLQMKLGPRFDTINNAASVLLYKHEDVVYLTNDRFEYELSFPGTISVLKRKIHREERYRTDSLYAGLRFAEKKKNVYDALLLINGEEIEYGEIKSIDYYIKMRRIKKGESLQRINAKSVEKGKNNIPDIENNAKILHQWADSYTRESLEKGENFILSTITFGNDKKYKGYELVSHSKKRGFVVQLVTSEELFSANSGSMKKTVESFTYFHR